MEICLPPQLLISSLINTESDKQKDWSSERKERDGGEESPQIPQRKILHTDVKSTRGRADVEVFTCLHLFLLVFVISLINIQIISRGGYRTESLSSAVKVGCSLCGASSVELLYCRAASRAKRAVCLEDEETWTQCLTDFTSLQLHRTSHWRDRTRLVAAQ